MSRVKYWLEYCSTNIVNDVSNRKRKRNTSHCIATVRSIPLLHSVVEQHSGGAVAVVDVMIFDLPH